MLGRTTALALATLFGWAAGVFADAPMLELIPEGGAAFAIRNLNDLRKKGDKFVAETGFPDYLRPSQLFEVVWQGLGITDGIDANASAAFILANPQKAGVELGKSASAVVDQWANLMVFAVPYTDRDKIAANFGIKKGTLKLDKMVPGHGHDFGKFFYAHGHHLFFGNNEKAVNSVVKGKSAGAALTLTQCRSLNAADMLAFIDAQSWKSVWDELLKELERDAVKSIEENDRKTARQFIDTLSSVRSVLMAIRIDGGLGINLVNIFPKDAKKSARKFLTALQGGSGASALTGLPNGSVVAAQAMEGKSTQSAAIVQLFFNWLLGNTAPTKLFLASDQRANFAGIFTEVWQHLKGSRVAIYQNADKQKFGLFSGVAILDTDDSEQFLKDMKQLAHLSDSAGLTLSGPDAHKDDVATVERLIRDLGDRKFVVRQSASTKLRLIGEPALPYLEAALKSDDLEVVHRAQDIKEHIVKATAAKRKELLSKDVNRPLRPSLAFDRRPENHQGQRIELLRVKLSGKDAAVSRQLRGLFGSDWDKIRLASHGKHVIVLLGSNQTLLWAALQNLQEGKPGLAGSKRLAAFARHTNPARKFEFHVSLQTFRALMAAADVGLGARAAQGSSLTSFAVTVQPQRLQLDIWMPSPEVKLFLEHFGL